MYTELDRKRIGNPEPVTILMISIDRNSRLRIPYGSHTSCNCDILCLSSSLLFSSALSNSSHHRCVCIDRLPAIQFEFSIALLLTLLCLPSPSSDGVAPLLSFRAIWGESFSMITESFFGGAFVAEYFRDKTVSDKDNINNMIESSIETSINKDGSYSSKRLMLMNDEQSKDSDFILNAHGFDPACWKIVSLRNNIRQVISKQDGIVTLYASFLTVKPVLELTINQIEEFL